jgi:hypothetical protein
LLEFPFELTKAKGWRAFVECEQSAHPHGDCVVIILSEQCITRIWGCIYVLRLFAKRASPVKRGVAPKVVLESLKRPKKV